jgi:hypothetical protein
MLLIGGVFFMGDVLMKGVSGYCVFGIGFIAGMFGMRDVFRSLTQGFRNIGGRRFYLGDRLARFG